MGPTKKSSQRADVETTHTLREKKKCKRAEKRGINVKKKTPDKGKGRNCRE